MKILTLYVSKSYIENFKEKAYNFFRNRERLDQFGYSTYFKLCLLNFQNYLLNQNIDLIVPDDSYLNFYSRKGNINTLDPERYDRKNVESLTLSINSYHELAYMLMHTYYINFLKDYRNYSISFFFYDIMRTVHNEDYEFKNYPID
jgi:hypothetical protein